MLKRQENGALAHLLEVRLRQSQHNVDRVKVDWILRLNDVHDLDDVRMLELLQEIDLAQYTLAVYFVLEHVVHALNGYFSLGRQVNSAAYGTVGAAPEQLYGLVVLT